MTRASNYNERRVCYILSESEHSPMIIYTKEISSIIVHYNVPLVKSLIKHKDLSLIKFNPVHIRMTFRAYLVETIGKT